MIKNYFKIAWRNLSRNKIYSFINISGLALGLASAMLIILYIKDEVSYDRFQKNLDNTYRIVTDWVGPDGGVVNKDSNTGFLQGPRFTENVSGIRSFVRIQSGQEDIKKGSDVQSQGLLRVDANFFSVFSFPLLSGNPNTCLSQPKSIVLSEEVAKRRFGTTDVVGKTMMVTENGEFVPYSITAVAKKCPQNSSIKFDVLLPFKVEAKDMTDNENWFNFFLNTFVVLDPKTDLASVERNMQNFYESDSREAIISLSEKYGPSATSEKTKYRLQPFVTMHLSKDLPPQNGLSDASNPIYSCILSGIALFILIIACINFINLTVARSLKRAREIGIRKVVGSGRKQLTFQFLGESFLLCFISFVLALVIVQLVLPVFNDLSNKALALSYLFDTKLIVGYIVLLFVTTILAGFYPALVLSGYRPVQTLYGRFNLSGKNYLQKGLVVLQFTLASFLIISTITIYSQFNYLTHEKLGYDDSDLVVVNKNMLKHDEAKLLRNKLMEDPNILGVAAKNNGFWKTSAKVNSDSIVLFTYETVDESYLPLLRIPVNKGRNFSVDFPSDSSSSVLVNESFVEKAGWKNPIGQTVDFWYYNKKYTVVGVVADYHYRPLNQKIEPQLFTMKASNDYGSAYIKIKPNSATGSLKHIQKTFQKLFPLNPYSYAFMDLENVKNYESEAKWKQIMFFGAILTIFISCIGLFGLSVLASEKRTKEIGIRKVLGASVKNIVATLSTDFIKLVAIALIIAVPLASVASNKWLENYPYRISLSWWIFVIAGIMVLTIALLTVSWQSFRAAMANPVEALRDE